ncbi:MAG: hypothetical protein ABJ000_05810 [Saccharospirillum sp.]
MHQVSAPSRHPFAGVAMADAWTSQRGFYAASRHALSEWFNE